MNGRMRISQYSQNAEKKFILRERYGNFSPQKEAHISFFLGNTTHKLLITFAEFLTTNINF